MVIHSTALVENTVETVEKLQQYEMSAQEKLYLNYIWHSKKHPQKEVTHSVSRPMSHLSRLLF